MKNIVLPLVVLFVFLNGCASDKNESVAKVCTIKIEGMMCEKGCKSTIESKLSKMEGVTEAKIDFESATAVVIFDASITSSQAMIDMISKIADGAYSATLVEESVIEAVVPSNLSKDEHSGATVKSFNFTVPTIHDLFSNIF